MRFLIVLSFILTVSLLYAQPDEKCGTMVADSMLRSKVANSPSLIDFESWLQLKMNEPENRSAQRGAIVTIPVIVHVVHNGDAVGTGQNLSQAQVMSQFDVLNEDFRRMNADAVNTPAAFQSVAADIEIEFCPAVVDPNGNLLAEPGIDRVSTAQSTWGQSDIDITLKPSTIWDPNRYFNIWTVDFGGSSLLGYAQFPEGSGLAGMPAGAQAANTDGIVCRYNAFGRVGNLNAQYNEGRTATHETGHWLGLRHIWGDGGCNEDDFCGDTPESDASNNGCLTGYISCGNVNMVQNYMDYSDDACMNLFTICQKTRMRTVLQNSPRRVELLNSTACVVLDQYTVTGQVRDAQTAQGVPFAKVRFKNSSFNYTANCDANGNFTIVNAFEGTYDVYGGKWGYVTASQSVTVQASMQPVLISVNKGYYDDFVLDFAWAISGTATAGEWERAQPVGTTFNGVASNPGADVTNDFGTECFTTGNGGGAAGTDDVDNGNTVLTSPTFDLTAYSEPYLKFYRWFYNDGGSGTPNDQLVIRISNGTTTATIETLVYNTPNANQWNFRSVRITDYISLTANMTFALETGDLNASGHLVEAGLDLFRITDSVSTPQADLTASGLTEGCTPFTVDFLDMSSGNATTWQWSFPGGTPATSSLQNPIIVYNTPGTYSVSLTAGNNSGTNTATLTNYITVHARPQVTNITANHVSCFNAGDGIASVTVLQGTAPYTITWSDGQTGLARNNLTPGNYSATVSDANGCKDTSAAITIMQPAVLSLATSSTPEVCSAQNGTATVIPIGGVPPYTIHWSNNFSTAIASGLASGQYGVTVTDANQCQATASVSVAASNNAPVVVLTAANVSCFGLSDGGLTTAVSGGVPPYNYLWSTNATTADISTLIAGSYTVTVTDANGCAVVESNPVTQPAVLALSDSVTQSTCGANSGAIAITVSGGIPPYTYLWNNGNTVAARTNLAAGTYRVTVTDDNGCTASKSITITQSSSLTVIDSITNTTCGLDNGSVTLAVSSGTAPYTYLWNGGSTNATRTNLAAASYQVTVSDANNCSATKTIAVATSTGLAVGAAVGPTSCGADNGAIALAVSNGLAPFAYLWNDGDTIAARAGLAAGNYTVTVSDANGCSATHPVTVAPSSLITVASMVEHPRCGVNNGSILLSAGTSAYTYVWNTGSTQASINNVAAGNYSVTIADSSGCTEQRAFTLTALGALQIQLTQADAFCFGSNDGTISVNVISGTPPFTYDWSTNDNTQTLTAGAGQYAVVVFDSLGCTAVADTTISEPTLLSLAVQAHDLVCSDKLALATAAASGGVSPYTYLWNNIAGNDSVYLNDGFHYAMVVDANGCIDADSFFVNSLPEPQYTLQSTADTAGRNTGAATVTILSAAAPYQFEWSGGQTDSTLTGLSAGVYYVTITDGNGCEVEDSVVIDAAVNVTQIGNLELTIYPNPNEGLFNIAVSNTSSSIRAEGYNVLGEKIFSIDKFSATPTAIDVRKFGRGVYFIRMFVGDDVVVRKVVYE